MKLWPEIRPYKTGYLKASEIHEVYYELCGNPKGKPVFVIHGGPGGGCSPYMRRFFDPKKFNIILHDQRGCGRSRPYAELRENTTQNLIKDIESLRTLLKLDKIILFGGSWGTTLSLAYAETYPENVKGMVLRGVFTATKEELNHFYHGGVSEYFPEVYEKFTSSLPEPDKRPLPEYLLKLIQSDDPAQREKYSKIWAAYEFRIAAIHFPENVINQILANYNPHAFALLESYYMANDCFLEEGQLFRDAGKIKDIPLIMVNGRYDVICPPVTAYRLSKILPKSKLVIAEGAGHAQSEKPVEQALLKAMKEFE